MSKAHTSDPAPDMPFPPDVTRAMQKAARRVAMIKCKGVDSRRVWLGNLVVRQFVVECYGRLSIDEAARQARKRFGALAPSKLVISRFYKAVSRYLREGARHEWDERPGGRARRARLFYTDAGM